MRQNKKNIIKKPCPDISLLIKANCIAIDLRFLWEKIEAFETALSKSEHLLEKKYQRNFKDWNVILRFMYLKIQDAYSTSEIHEVSNQDIKFKLIKDARGHHGN